MLLFDMWYFSLKLFSCCQSRCVAVAKCVFLQYLDSHCKFLLNFSSQFFARLVLLQRHVKIYFSNLDRYTNLLLYAPNGFLFDSCRLNFLIDTLTFFPCSYAASTCVFFIYMIPTGVPSLLNFIVLICGTLVLNYFMRLI